MPKEGRVSGAYTALDPDDPNPKDERLARLQAGELMELASLLSEGETQVVEKGQLITIAGDGTPSCIRADETLILHGPLTYSRLVPKGVIVANAFVLYCLIPAMVILFMVFLLGLASFIN